MGTSSGDFHKPITGKLRDGIISGAANPLAARDKQSQIDSVLQNSSYPVVPRPPHKRGEVTLAPCTWGRVVTVGSCNSNHGVLWHMPAHRAVGGKKELPQVPTTEAQTACSCEK